MNYIQIPLSILIMVLGVLGSGCLDLNKGSVGENEVAKPEAPKVMTREEIYGELKTIISPYRRILLGQGGYLGDTVQQSIIAQLREAQLRQLGNPDGPAAIRDIGDDLVQYAREGKDTERWKLVQGCIDAHDLLNIESHLLKRLDTRAEEIMSRPAVTVRGYMEDIANKHFFVFLEIVDRSTGKIDTISVQEGDEFHRLRLVEVHPNKNEVVLEYLPIEGMFFTVEGVNKLGNSPSTL